MLSDTISAVLAEHQSVCAAKKTLPLNLFLIKLSSKVKSAQVNNDQNVSTRKEHGQHEVSHLFFKLGL